MFLERGGYMEDYIPSLQARRISTTCLNHSEEMGLIKRKFNKTYSEPPAYELPSQSVHDISSPLNRESIKREYCGFSKLFLSFCVGTFHSDTPRLSSC